jgi:tetratricopeptide (TPR) repeat protein
MGDLYESKGMIELAIDKYKTAADLFLKDSNKKSYACALRDCGRSYARIDSIEKAINILLQADSIANEIDNPNVKASIANTIAGTYLLSSNYNEAKSFYNKALLFSKNKTPNYIGLIEVYLATDSLEKAKNLLSELPQSTSPYIYTLKNLEYEINKKENNYEEALDNLEDCLFLIDSITRAENQSKIYEIEGKYNSLKAKEKVNELMIKNQKHLILTLFIIAVALIVIFTLIIQRKRGKEKIHEQRIALDKIKIDFLNLSIDLEKQQKQLKAYDEQSEQYTLILNSISLLRENYIKLQHKMVVNSHIYKELNLLANKNIPRNDKPLITSRYWELIVKEITEIYPNIYFFINDTCPNISEQEWQYCCLAMLEFDTNSEAKLLNINTASVRTKRLRLRQKLNLTLGPKETLSRHIADKLIP